MKIQEAFHQVLAKKLAVAAFEAWVYATPELEEFLGEADYFELISLKYRDKAVLHNLRKLLDKYIGWGQVYTRELEQVLQTIINRPTANEVLTALVDSYNWWCDGYDFLKNLGFDYGMVADGDFGWEENTRWKKMPEAQKERYIAQFYPAVEQEAKRVLNWLETGKIRILPRPSQYEVDYADDRSTAERESLPVKNVEGWYVPTAPATTVAALSNATTKANSQETKRWWMFWKR